MNALHTSMDAVWSNLGSSVVHGTVLAVITYILTRTLLRNARPALISALWTIVLLKFLVPVGPEVPISLSGALDTIIGVDAAVAPAVHLAPDAQAANATLAATSGDPSNIWTWLGIGLMVLYALAIAGIVWHRIRQERRLRRWAASLPQADASLARLARRIASEMGLSRTPSMRVCPELVAPQIVGIGRPVVVAPTGYRDGLDQAEEQVFEAMLLHEFAHLRRRDTWLRGLQLVAATLFFFWPVVRWVNRRIDEEREMACDQWVLAHGRMSATQYARTLVTLARRLTQTQSPAFAPALPVPGDDRSVLGMAIHPGHKQLSRRVTSLMRGASKPRVGLVTGAIIVLYAAVSLGHSERAHTPIVSAEDECVIESGLVEYIMVTYPEADTDGDGELSRDEVCAQKKRLQEMVALDQSIDPALSEALSPDSPDSLDPVLAALDDDWLYCQSCGCALDAPAAGTESIAESDPRFFDKKVCTTN